ncbi:MAG: hypothetical protein GW949_03065 [Spirochaetales bacterium]|nr:hypothetical protein [Spirochaetales bacterium]
MDFFSPSTRRTLIIILFSTVFLFGFLFGSFGQTEVVETDPNDVVIARILGDQHFSFALGPYIPLFSYDPNTGESESLIGSTADPRLSLGAIGTLRWGAFVNSVINLGLDLSWAFNVGANGDLLSQFAPLTARMSTYLRSGAFEFPLHLGLGMNILSYKETTILTPLVKAGGSVLWNPGGDWAFGFNLMYWWIPELYGDAAGSPGPSNNRFGNFLEVSLSALYNF